MMTVDAPVKTRTRIILADDHAVLRQALRRLLDAEPDLTVVAEAENGRAAVAQAQEVEADLVILDVAMPGLDAFAAARAILRARRETKILVLSMHSDLEHVTSALEAGALGYVLKGDSADVLLEAVRAVMRSETFLSPSLPAGRLELLRRPKTNGAKLTDREREVAKLLAEGHTVRRIGGMLGISAKTVDVHKTHLMKKLDIHNRVDLVKYALATRLIQI